MEVIHLLMQEYPIRGNLFTFMCGAAMGSFVHCMGYRMARHMSLRQPPSACVHCGHVLTARDLIPIFSYLYCRGRCRVCGTAFSGLYLWVEILAGVGFPVLYLMLGSAGGALIGVAFWWLTLFIFSYLLHKKQKTHQV